MNDEKKIAQVIVDVQRMRMDNPYGEYKQDMESCLIESCKKNGLSPNLWALLNLAIWQDDIQLWAEDILAGKNILEECEKENAKMKDGQKQIGEETDNNTVVSIEGILGGKRRKIIFDK